MVWVLQTSSEVESPSLEGRIKLGETRGGGGGGGGGCTAQRCARLGVSAPSERWALPPVPRCSGLIPGFPETIQTYDGSSDTSELGRFWSLEKLKLCKIFQASLGNTDTFRLFGEDVAK